MAEKVIFGGNMANYRRFNLHNGNRLRLESVLKAFEASCIMLEDWSLLDAGWDGLTMDTFDEGMVHNITLIPAAKDTSI